MKVSGFSSTLSSQITNFSRYGFVLIRGPAHLKADFVESINTEVLTHFDEIESSYKYRFWRFCNSVSTPTKRHSVPLKLTPGVRQLLNTNVSHVFPFLKSQLSLDSPLVELSSIISQSGSLDQETHSDVPLSSPLILSVFVALTKVTIENGPTCMYSGSHTATFHHINAEPSANKHKYFSSDGHDEDLLQYQSEMNYVSPDVIPLVLSTLEGTQVADEYPPYCALLEPGDMLLFNTKIAHHGLANGSLRSRSLLCFAFQEPDARIASPSKPRRDDSESSSDEVEEEEDYSVVGADRLSPRVDGFTYHCHPSMMAEKITLNDFCGTKDVVL